MMRTVPVALAIAWTCAVGLAAQQPAGPDTAEISAAINRLGAFDYPVRMEAARVVRRGAPSLVEPLLVAAVRAHQDEYVRYRALVLLIGFGEGMEPSAPAGAVDRVMRAMIRDRNDRLRTVAYQWFEYHPDTAMLPDLLAALVTERSEFVRPALTRAIAAQGADARARAALAPLVMRGEDFFRGAVISALGDYKGRYALPQILEVAQLDGPLQDDAISALGNLGDESVKATLGALQKAAPQELQPTVSAALCLIGIDCDARRAYLSKTLAFAAATDGYQPLLRGAVHAVGMLAVRGRDDALGALIDAGIASQDPARAAIALGIGTAAVRSPMTLLRVLEARPDSREAILLLREAFDMLVEDFEEERFYLAIRRALWEAPEGSARRRTAAAVIEILEF